MMAAISGQVAAMLVLNSTLASAEPERPEAEQLLRRGRKLMAQKKFTEACAAVEESQHLNPALGTLLTIADCFEQLGRTASAFMAFNEAAVWAGRNNEVRREELATRRAQALEARLVFVAVDLAGPRIGAVAQVVDDATHGVGPRWALDSTTSNMPLDPGTYSLLVSANGHVTAVLKFEVHATPGVLRLEVPALKPLVAGPPVPLPAPSAPLSAAPGGSPSVTVGVSSSPYPVSRPLGVLATALGGGLLLAGGVGVGLSYSVLDRFARQQTGGPDYDNPSVTRADYATARVLYPTSWVALGIGAAGLAAGAILLVFSHVPAALSLVPIPGGTLVAVAGLTWD
jgi:hypothetical protein